MPTRRAKAAANRQAHHQRQLERATTDHDRLWAACSWLVAEAIRAGHLGNTTRAVLCLVQALLDGPPTTDRVFDSMSNSSGPDPNRVPNARVSARAGARTREISNYTP